MDTFFGSCHDEAMDLAKNDLLNLKGYFTSVGMNAHACCRMHHTSPLTFLLIFDLIMAFSTWLPHSLQLVVLIIKTPKLEKIHVQRISVAQERALDGASTKHNLDVI